MKDVNDIKDLIKIMKSVESEAHNYIKGKLPEVGEKLVSDLFDLIANHGKDFHLGLHPEIELDIAESKVYLRILPLEAGPRMSTAERQVLYPSYSLHSLLDVKECELYSKGLRERIISTLSDEIRRGLRSIGVKSKLTYVAGYWRETTSYKIILKF